MITKGIVVGKSTSDNNKYIVRLPIFNSLAGTPQSTPDDELNEAILCSIPNIRNVVNTGDVVIVGFEDNDMGRPIILGRLFLSEQDVKCGLDLDSLSVASNCNLPASTTIGNVNKDNIACLEDCTLNIARTLNYLLEEIENLKAGG